MEKIKRRKLFTKQELLDEMVVRIAEVKEQLPALKSLTPEQLNWKPNKKKWSVGQLIEHLNLFQDHYLTRQLKPKLNLAHTNLPDEDLTTGKFARTFLMATHPGYHKRTKSQKPLKPAKETNANEMTVKYFDAHLVVIDELIVHFQNININSYTIGFIVNEMMMRFKFGSALYMTVNHNARHFDQIQKIMSDPEFPK
ncbi:MAG: DinB family protein [Flavobacteriales bacterium]|nr:DinB family protein [Flavobacteriales bacterium]